MKEQLRLQATIAYNSMLQNLNCLKVGLTPMSDLHQKVIRSIETVKDQKEDTLQKINEGLVIYREVHLMDILERHHQEFILITSCI